MVYGFYKGIRRGYIVYIIFLLGLAVSLDAEVIENNVKSVGFKSDDQNKISNGFPCGGFLKGGGGGWCGARKLRIIL